ncbi:MAG: hypothetical protein DMG83_27720, partial [Acidobacteria bacterium]
KGASEKEVQQFYHSVFARTGVALPFASPRQTFRGRHPHSNRSQPLRGRPTSKNVFRTRRSAVSMKVR